MAVISSDIEQAIELLKAGEIIAIPTETVYGLAGNALSEKAVLRIFTVKDRPHFNPLILHTDSMDKISKNIGDIPPLLRKVAEKCWPGPLTILIPKLAEVNDLVTGGSSLVGVRIPKHPLTQQLLSRLDFPLAAPSANPFGYVSPTKPDHVQKQLGSHIPFILDGGSCAVGVESTIIGLGDEPDTIKIYRLGGVPVEQIAELVDGKVELFQGNVDRPEASGMLKSHYATQTPLLMGDIARMLQYFNPNEVGVLSFSTTHEQVDPQHQKVLSPEGDLNEAAKNLFSYMRYLDTLGLKAILAERVPDFGLGQAINDRLERALHENKD